MTLTTRRRLSLQMTARFGAVRASVERSTSTIVKPHERVRISGQHGEERIANELLLKLGLRVSPRTVRKYGHVEVALVLEPALVRLDAQGSGQAQAAGGVQKVALTLTPAYQLRPGAGS